MEFNDRLRIRPSAGKELGIITAKFCGDQGVKMPPSQENHYRINIGGIDVTLSESAVINLFEPYTYEDKKPVEITMPEPVKVELKKKTKRGEK